MHPWRQRWFQDTGTMLGQIRTLFIGFVLVWPLVGLWGVGAATDDLPAEAAVVASVALAAWLYTGYRRRHFAAWTWIIEGACVFVVAGASHYGPTVGLCFLWVNFRALYGGLRQTALAAVVLVAVMSGGVVLFDVPVRAAIPLLLTSVVALLVNNALAAVSGARDRAGARERAAATAGAGLAAANTRAEAMDITLGAALSMDDGVGAGLIATLTGGSLHVIAAAGDVGAETEGLVTDLAILPATAKAALTPGGYAQLTGRDAGTVSDAMRLDHAGLVVLAPLAAGGRAFGFLMLVHGRRTRDDLSASVKLLADSAALTLDQLLSRSRLSVVVEHSPDALMLAGESGVIRFVNPGAETLLEQPSSALIGRNIWSLLHVEDRAALQEPRATGTAPVAVPCRIRGSDGAGWARVEAIVDYVSEHDGSLSIVFNARDVSERQRLELELRHAQKLESVGRLAAGIAHEINTPIQFVGDNARFLENAFAELNSLQAAYQKLADVVADDPSCAEALAHVRAVAGDVDIDFLTAEVPLALTQTLEGIDRVANIVRAMKAFGHPGTEEMTQADLNVAIANTLTVANNEIKYVADTATDFADLPLVQCHLGDINQIMLNLVVNAAHAIRSADRGRGMIRISTRLADGHVLIEVADNGTGVPPEIADKLFDPFFTTKDVGAGTGQGLPLVRTLVVDRHGGTVDFTTEPGHGTTFTVRLPVQNADRSTNDLELAVAR